MQLQVYIFTWTWLSDLKNKILLWFREWRFCVFINSFTCVDTICNNGTWLTFIRATAWCSQTPLHYLNHVWLIINEILWHSCSTVYPKKYAHGFCFAVLCCGYTLTDFPISIRLTSLALWQSNDYPSASKATLMNMDKYFMWIHYERLHNHNKAKHNKTVCIFLGIYCRSSRENSVNVSA